MASQTVHLKEWTSFAINGRYFLVRVKTQFSQELCANDYLALQELPYKGPCELDEAQIDLAKRCKLINPNPKTEEEETASERRLAENALANIPPFSSLELLVAQTCNMRCRYCYAGDGEYGNRGKMSWDVAKTALDCMIKTLRTQGETTGTIPCGSVLFFGGEPLMNLELIKQCVDYCSKELGEEKFQFSLTTNGILLTPETMDWLDGNKVSYSLSFDGPYQNENRPICTGEDSHEMIVGRIRQVIAKHGACSIISTVYPEQSSSEVLREIKELFGDKVNYQVNVVQGSSITKTWRSGPCAEMNRRTEEYPLLTDQLIDAIKNRDEAGVKNIVSDNYFRKFFTGAMDTPGPRLTPLYCGCGRPMCSIDTEGAIYPCQTFVGDEKYCQGSLSTGYNRGVFAHHITQENPKCRHCPVRYACTGDCMSSVARLPEAEGFFEPVFYAPKEFCQLQHKKQQLRALIYWTLTDDDRFWYHSNFDRKPH